jgi:hypothetical protein
MQNRLVALLPLFARVMPLFRFTREHLCVRRRFPLMDRCSCVRGNVSLALPPNAEGSATALAKYKGVDFDPLLPSSGVACHFQPE